MRRQLAAFLVGGALGATRGAVSQILDGSAYRQSRDDPDAAIEMAARVMGRCVMQVVGGIPCI
jgi:hypothetical protein